MKSCPACRRLFADEAGFCPIHGIELLAARDVVPKQDPKDPLVGRNLADRYQVRRTVAQGGMGRVYEALDLHARQKVAIKVLHRHVARDRVAIERFKREYEISKLLPHEHIVEVFDFLYLEGETYVLVMDYLEGEELRALLKRDGTVRPARLVRMISQIAIGLDEAHRRQLIHRDIKPDNVFLCGTHDGDVVKLLDFGSVKDTSLSAKKLTVMGTTVGSPFYMSPEQAEGLDTLDSRTDVWALAAICYESLTGQVPFVGRNGPRILLSILTEEHEPASKVAAARSIPFPIPPSVDQVFLKAFAKEQTKRVASVGLLADMLGHAYGLAGSHRDWAYTPEPLLVETVIRALSEMMPSRHARTATEGHQTEERSIGRLAEQTDGRREAAVVSVGSSGVLLDSARSVPMADGQSTVELRARLMPKKLPEKLFAGVVLVVLVAAVIAVVVLVSKLC